MHTIECDDIQEKMRKKNDENQIKQTNIHIYICIYIYLYSSISKCIEFRL